MNQVSFLRVYVLVLSLGALAYGQEFRGSINGQVTDPTQASISGAELTLKNTGTGVERKTLTDDQGRFFFQFVPPGSYSLTTRASGFKVDQRDGIQISLSDNVRLDIALALGSATETVTVLGSVATVQTESAALGSVVRQEIIDSLPLKGHSSLFMFTLATGVVNNRYGEDTRPNDTITNVSYTSNGSPMASGDVSVDGVANTVNVNRGVNISQWVPARFAVQEFKLQTGTLSAEHGRSGGSIMSLVIKSGTNQFHGDAYEFLRNAALDANLFYNNARGARLARYGSNTYGASLGGPILIPKLYDGRNRTFFFFNYEGSREGNGISPLINVPTAKMRQGDFSEITQAIYDPFSVSTVNNVPTRTPFAGNVIPQSRQDPVGRSVMNFWPAANLPGVRPGVQNYAFSTKWPRDYESIVLKIDQQISQNNQMFVRFNNGEGRLVFPYDFEGIATSGGNRVKRPHTGVAISDTHIINPRTTLDVRLGYSRGIENNRPYSDGFDLSSIGFPSSYRNLIQSQAFPNISVTDFQAMANSPYIYDVGDTWSLQPAMTRQQGRHLLKVGGETRLLRGHFFRNTTPAGRFSFAPQQTGGPSAATPTGGFGLASLLVGFGSGAMPSNTGVSIQNVYYGLYFQDDWRVSPRLTLNLGLRWEYESPRTERYNRTVRGWAYGQQSPLRVPGLNLTGGLLYAGVGGNDRGLYAPDRNNFAPRVGFAFSLNKQTVLRGGYALSYIPVIGSVLATGYSIDTPWVSSTDGSITVANRLSNPFPTGLLPAVGNSQGLATLVGQNVDFIEPADRVPQFHNWNFNIQRELPSQGLVEIAYVGSRAVDLVAATEQLNQLPVEYFSQGTALTQLVPNPFFGVLTSGTLTGATVQRQQLLRPYPQYTGVTRLSPAYGNSVYHSLQAKYEKRMAAGVTGLVSYTFSKNIGDLEAPQNAYNRRAERAITDLDAPHRLTIAGAWQLPVGKGRALATNANRALDTLIGGWQISTFATFQSGFGLRFGTQGGTFPTGVGAIRPNVVGDPAEGTDGSISNRLDRYFNTAAFVRPADFTLGNLAARIGSVRSPGMNNVNITLAKDFKIGEQVVMEFRGSMFNAFNHPVFGGPNTTVGNTSFGRISSQANLSRQVEFGLRLTY